jgi:PPM family protein phosphatase
MKSCYKVIEGIGKRENQEDAHAIENNLFIVCDGVGGKNKGELASKLCVTSLIKLANNDLLKNEYFFHDTLAHLELEFEDYISNNPLSYGMATTLALLQIKDKNAFIAHVGDSRIYHIRNGEILFETKDHSFVNDLIEAGIINNEEAKSHPKRNVITKAVEGLGKPTKASVKILDNIEVGDYFMLCSDGILESIDDIFIIQEFKTGNKIEDIGDKIKDKCNEFSSDNFTALIVQIS